MVPLRPYLLGGVAAAALIAAAVAGFLSIATAFSESTLQDGIRAVPAPPPDTLNIGAGNRPARAASRGGVARAAPSLAGDPIRAPDLRSGVPEGRGGAGEPTQGRASSGASHPARGLAPRGDLTNGGTPSGGAGNGGTAYGAGGGASHAGAPPAPVSAKPPAKPRPVLAKRPGGPPPGLAKKPGGRPPGLAKKPGGPPPGQAKKHA
jgi:hypothetical protein